MERVKELEKLLKERKKPEPENEKKEALKLLAAKAMQEKILIPKKRLWRRLFEQAAWIPARTWLALSVFSLGSIYLLLYFPYERALTILSLCMPFAGIFFLPEIAKSFSEGMWELEQACVYNLKEIISLKMSIFGIMSLLMFGLSSAVVGMEKESLLKFYVWVILPFLFVSSLSFLVLRAARGEKAEYGIMGVNIAGMSLVVLLWNFADAVHVCLYGENGQFVLASASGVLIGGLIWNAGRFYVSVSRAEFVWRMEA